MIFLKFLAICRLANNFKTKQQFDLTASKEMKIAVARIQSEKYTPFYTFQNAGKTMHEQTEMFFF